jgi:uncharacterized membrane protein (DUF2068 family)
VSAADSQRVERRKSADELGFEAVILYKMLKALSECVLAAVLVFLVLAGLAEVVHNSALNYSSHLSRAWAVRLVRLIGRVTTNRRIELTALALFADGLLTFFEGWALRRRFWWAPWLVVVASGSLLPFEVFELIRRLAWTRLSILIINAVIVVFLIWHALRHGRSRASPEPSRE